MSSNVRIILKVNNTKRSIVERYRLRKVSLLLVFFAATFLAANAIALTQEQLTFIKESAIELCRGGTLEGEASTYRIEGGAEAKTFIIKKLIELGVEGEIELTGTEWKGIKAVIPEKWDADAWTKCVTPTLEFFARKLEDDGSSQEDEIELAVRAMEWFESRCGPGIRLIVPYGAGSKSDFAARSFYTALGESGVKPLLPVVNMPGVFVKNGRFSVEKFDKWQRTNVKREGCMLTIVPDYVQDRFPRPRYNVIAGERLYSIVLPRGTLTEVADRWNLVFKKADKDPDFIREINRSNVKVELIEAK